MQERSNRPEEGAPVPVRGPVETTIQFSSEKGCSWPVRWSLKTLAAMILPPMYFSLSSSVQGYSATVWLVRSTRTTRPIYPPNLVAMRCLP